MQQANIINIISNKYGPQRKHRLGTVSKNYVCVWGGGGGVGGGLNRFYGIPTSPSAKYCFIAIDQPLW